MAFVVREQDIPNIWIYHIESGALNQLTFYRGDGVPALDWSPDSKSVAYATKSEDSTNSIYIKRIDGSGKAQKIFTSLLNDEMSVRDWSRDGHTILASEWRPISDHDIFSYSFKDSSAKSYLSTREHEEHPEFSPNGLWVVYRGDNGVYVRPYPENSGGLWKISNGGGQKPVWSPDGKRIFYRNGNAMYAVDVNASDLFSKGNPKKIFEGNYFLRGIRKFDIHPDGKSFIMIQPSDTAPQEQKIYVIQNFSEELKRLAPVGRD